MPLAAMSHGSYIIPHPSTQGTLQSTLLCYKVSPLPNQWGLTWHVHHPFHLKPFHICFKTDDEWIKRP